MRLTTVFRAAGFAALSLLAFGALAQSTTVLVHGLSNCVLLSHDNRGSGLPVAFDLKAGQYKLKIVSSTTTICGEDRCAQHAVLLELQGVDYNSPYMQTPFVVREGSVHKLNLTDDVHGLAYITDTVCYDNTGTTVLKITPVDSE
jgi:hypothetical protein